MAEFLKPIYGQTWRLVFRTYHGLHLREFAQKEETVTDFGSLYCFFLSFCACSEPRPLGPCPHQNSVSRAGEHDPARTLRGRGSVSISALTRRLSLFDGRAGRVCCLKGEL